MAVIFLTFDGSHHSSSKFLATMSTLKNIPKKKAPVLWGQGNDLGKGCYSHVNFQIWF